MRSQLSLAGWFGWRMICVLLPVTASAQEAWNPSAVWRWGVEDGLPHNAVYAITQDPRGFIWLGTQDGLVRFDGFEFSHFGLPEGGGPGLSSRFVTALLASEDGAIWVGTRRGLHRIDPDHAYMESIELTAGGAQSAVHYLLNGRDGAIWTGTDSGLYRVEVSGSRHIPLVVDDTAGYDVATAAVSADGMVWAILRGAPCLLVGIQSSGTINAPPVSAPCADAMAVDADGRIWLDLHSPWKPGEGTAFPAGNPPPWGLIIHNGELLSSSIEGVHRRDRESGTIYQLWSGRGEGSAKSLSGEVLSLLPDADGGFWFGTYDGVFRYDPAAPRFEILRASGVPDLRLEDTPVSTLLGTRDGRRLWIGTFGAGLLLLDRFDSQWRHWPPDLRCGEFVWTLEEADPESVLINGVCLVTSTGEVEYRPPLESFSVRSTSRTSDGSDWIAGVSGLYRRSDNRWEKVLDGALEVAVADPRGGLWLAAAPEQEAVSGTWLRRFDPGTGNVRHFDLPVREFIFDLLQLGDELWIATGYGLLGMHTSSGKTRHHLPAETDAGTVFYSLAADRSGRLWIGTNRGLMRFDPEASEGQRFRAYDRLDGLENHEFNRRARHLGSDGRLYLGGMNGVTVFDPGLMVDDTRKPRPELTLIHVFGAGGERRFNALGRSGFEIGPRDYAVTFDYAGIGFVRADRYRYRYRLRDVDADWVDAGGQRSARYTNLAAGRYRFEVHAANRDGYWSDYPAAIELTVVPAWYATTWARAGALLLLGALLAWAYRARVRHLLALERMRLRIAGDLHDELGSELAAIRVNAALVESGRELDDSQRSRLRSIGTSTDLVVQALRDIVWYVNPEHDRLDALIERMRDHAWTVLPAQQLTFEAAGTGDNLPLSMAARRQIYLIFKEALNNLVRHAAARTVHIGVALESERLTVEIQDDGRGFIEHPGDGTGLASMRRRAAAIGASLRIDSTPGAGTVVRLVLPMTQMRPGRRRRRAVR